MFGHVAPCCKRHENHLATMCSLLEAFYERGLDTIVTAIWRRREDLWPLKAPIIIEGVRRRVCQSPNALIVQRRRRWNINHWWTLYHFILLTIIDNVYLTWQKSFMVESSVIRSIWCTPLVWSLTLKVRASLYIIRSHYYDISNLR